MTPIQKAIAKIESLIEKHLYVVSTPQGHSYIDGLRAGLSILTANLDYERECMEQAYNAGRFDGNYGCEQDFSEYFNQTYGHDS